MPALPRYIFEPIFEQFRALLPDREVDHPLGCHRSRIPDRVVFGKLVQILVFGCAYRRIADEGCSATTLRDRREEWIELGVMETLRKLTLEAYERFIGLELADVAVDGCITKAPCGGEKAGRSPVDRGKRGIKRSTAVDGRGIPVSTVTAPANRYDSTLFWYPPSSAPARRWASSTRTGECPSGSWLRLVRHPRASVKNRGLIDEISQKGKPAPLASTRRWVIERTNSWHNAHKKLVWCTERRGAVIDFWVAFSEVVIVVRRLIREGWMRYRWESRPASRP